MFLHSTRHSSLSTGLQYERDLGNGLASKGDELIGMVREINVHH